MQPNLGKDKSTSLFCRVKSTLSVNIFDYNAVFRSASAVDGLKIPDAAVFSFLWLTLIKFVVIMVNECLKSAVISGFTNYWIVQSLLISLICESS